MKNWREGGKEGGRGREREEEGREGGRQRERERGGREKSNSSSPIITLLLCLPYITINFCLTIQQANTDVLPSLLF